LKKCQSPHVKIVNAEINTTYPIIFKQNELIQLISETAFSSTWLNHKEWKIFKFNDENEQQIFIYNNPTINCADLVLQPQTLSYGVYRIVFTVKMINTNCSASAFTNIRIIPSGLVLSSLKLSQPMYGGTIEITRGQNQQIQFDPYLFTYDIDRMAVITSLSFKYSCQLIDANILQGYPLQPGTNLTIYLDDFKANPTISQLNTCFNSTGMIYLRKFKSIYFDLKNFCSLRCNYI
jgi:hypothetical protein